MKRHHFLRLVTMAGVVLGAAMVAVGVWLLRTAVVWGEAAKLIEPGSQRAVAEFDAGLLGFGSMWLVIIGGVVTVVMIVTMLVDICGHGVLCRHDDWALEKKR